MVHNVDATLFLHGANKYTVSYEGTTIESGAANTVSFADCQNAASNLDMTTPALPAVVTAGTYTDTLSVTVTTQ